MNRPLKQFVYGLLYLILFFAASFLIYFLIFKPAPTCFDNKLNHGEEEVDCGGPCPSCELKRLEPLKISPVIILESGEDLITAIFDNKLNHGEEEVDCGGPCPSCELKRLEPLKISPVIILESGEDLITAIFEIRNPNRNYGSDKFTYVLNIY